MTITGTTARSGVLDALERAASGAIVSVDDAELLLQSRGDELDRLFHVASRLRDEGLERAGRPGVITFSKNNWSNKTGQLVQPSEIVAERAKMK